MHRDEKLEKVCSDFSLLNDEQQDYVLGILQALIFAKNSYYPNLPENQEIERKNDN